MQDILFDFISKYVDISEAGMKGKYCYNPLLQPVVEVK
jgi:hypothetical protein